MRSEQTVVAGSGSSMAPFGSGSCPNLTNGLLQKFHNLIYLCRNANRNVLGWSWMGTKPDFFHGFESRTFPVGSGSNPNLPSLCLLLAVPPKLYIKKIFKAKFLVDRYPHCRGPMPVYLVWTNFILSDWTYSEFRIFSLIKCWMICYRNGHGPPDPRLGSVLKHRYRWEQLNKSVVAHCFKLGELAQLGAHWAPAKVELLFFCLLRYISSKFITKREKFRVFSGGTIIPERC